MIGVITAMLLSLFLNFMVFPNADLRQTLVLGLLAGFVGLWINTNNATRLGPKEEEL
jgi:hypothetical protein